MLKQLYIDQCMQSCKFVTTELSWYKI